MDRRLRSSAQKRTKTSRRKLERNSNTNLVYAPSRAYANRCITYAFLDAPLGGLLATGTGGQVVDAASGPSPPLSDNQRRMPWLSSGLERNMLDEYFTTFAKRINPQASNICEEAHRILEALGRHHIHIDEVYFCWKWSSQPLF
ncbi:hypothetical protein KIN20_000975 [Parelaphostrongylus tenuis]|uniref:Uncharacterized protein n=1 Tax=Parelaphostrongylus tenuis TaxID=148309 RepID=A0AAD5QC82_PARTN|nr:hypothetical protein KIN20_000975 [Parelaphostrongylus tenuis]